MVKPFGFLLLLEVTHIECSARKLPDLRKSIFMCGLSQEKKEVSGKVSLPQIHHKFAIRDMKGFGSSPWSPTKEALLHLYWLLSTQPFYIYRKKEGWPSSTIWMLDCYTPTASVARCSSPSFLGPHRGGSISALVEISRLCIKITR